jgi:hypothetical protein
MHAGSSLLGLVGCLLVSSGCAFMPHQQAVTSSRLALKLSLDSKTCKISSPQRTGMPSSLHRGLGLPFGKSSGRLRSMQTNPLYGSVRMTATIPTPTEEEDKASRSRSRCTLRRLQSYLHVIARVSLLLCHCESHFWELLPNAHSGSPVFPSSLHPRAKGSSTPDTHSSDTAKDPHLSSVGLPRRRKDDHAQGYS